MVFGDDAGEKPVYLHIRRVSMENEEEKRERQTRDKWCRRFGRK
jgi:hypothetical protein